jgi:hypothetical protein
MNGVQQNINNLNKHEAAMSSKSKFDTAICGAIAALVFLQETFPRECEFATPSISSTIHRA